MSPGGARGTGERIAAARKLHRMTQAELAEAAAISVSLLRKIEQGTRPVTPGVLVIDRPHAWPGQLGARE